MLKLAVLAVILFSLAFAVSRSQSMTVHPGPTNDETVVVMSGTEMMAFNAYMEDLNERKDVFKRGLTEALTQLRMCELLNEDLANPEPKESFDVDLTGH